MTSEPATFTPPPWARKSHTINTPRLILRSALPDDAKAFTRLFREPKNNPFGGVVGNERTEEEQRANLAKQAASTARGDNGWLVVILKTDEKELPEGSEVLKVQDGLLIGSTGFNGFKMGTGIEPYPEEEVLLTDTGALIDFRFQRRGLALETLEAVIEYGFDELGATGITMDTNADNVPFRTLMQVMEIKEVDFRKGGRPDDEGDALSYKFGRDEWESSKKKLQGIGKWYL